MSVDLSTAPYYDDFNPDKKFAQIIAIPGRAEQAREFTQAQSILLNLIKKLSDALIKEGSIISGMDFTLVNNTLTVQPGKIYLNGIIHDFDGQTITITKTGVEIIGAKLVSQIITESDDASLRDPAQGFANYAQPGAHRVKYTVQIVVNDSTVPVIYTLIDGNLQTEAQRPELDVITDLLAKRLYDEAGNYKVNGLDMYVKPYDEDNIYLVVEAGKAYVLGYEVNRPSPAYVIVPKSKVLRSVTGELKVFRSDTDLYKLNNLNVKDITKVIATVQLTQTVSRGSVANGSDILNNTPVVQLVSIIQGGTTYTQGTDYQLSANSVDWSLGGIEPAIGTSYSVTYQYNKVLVPGTDYVLTLDEDDATIAYIDFSPAGDNPVNLSNAIIDYDYYLSRADRAYIDKNGVISLVQGQSDVTRLVSPPDDKDPNRLSLGVIYLNPNSSVATVDNEVINRLSMQDLAKLSARVDNLEYNAAISNLDTEAMSGMSPTTLKGVFTDGFIGFTKADLGHPSYSAGMNIANNFIELPATFTPHKPNITTAQSSVHKTTNFVVGGYTEEVVVKQPFSTRAINVNPYKVFTDATRVILSPASDNWIDYSTVNINGGTVSATYYTSWYSNYSVTSTSTSSKVTDSIITYARQIPITIHGEGFPPFSDSLKATIDGVAVNLTPVSGSSTIAGTAPGSVQADGNGVVDATFTIPTNIRTGARQVVLSNPLVNSSAIFTSSGTNRITTVTTTTVITNYRYDPLAQTFQVPNDRMITSLDLFFAAKDPTIPITVEIRDTMNGYPSSNTLTTATLKPSQISISANGHTNPTRVTFDNPVICTAGTQYAIVVMTTSDAYQLHVATLSGKDLQSNQFISTQPYTDGVLFSSSNAVTWTPDQSSDLRFELRGAVFNSQTPSVIQLDEISSIDIDGLLPMIDFDMPTGTSCQWQYRSGDSSYWLPITPNQLLDIDITNKVTVRALLYCTDYLSPVILWDTCNIVGTKVFLTGSYISKLVELSQPYTDIKVIIEANIPTNSTLQVQISADDGGTWTSLESSGSSSTEDANYTRFTYNHTLGSPSSQYRVRLNLGTSNRISKPRVRKLLNILT